MRNLLINKPILQLDGGGHADGLKAISGAPMPQEDNLPHLVGIEILDSWAAWGPLRALLELH